MRCASSGTGTLSRMVSAVKAAEARQLFKALPDYPFFPCRIHGPGTELQSNCAAALWIQRAHRCIAGQSKAGHSARPDRIARPTAEPAASVGCSRDRKSFAKCGSMGKGE